MFLQFVQDIDDDDEVVMTYYLGCGCEMLPLERAEEDENKEETGEKATEEEKENQGEE